MCHKWHKWDCGCIIIVMIRYLAPRVIRPCGICYSFYRNSHVEPSTTVIMLLGTMTVCKIIIVVQILFARDCMQFLSRIPSWGDSNSRLSKFSKHFRYPYNNSFGRISTAKIEGVLNFSQILISFTSTFC